MEKSSYQKLREKFDAVEFLAKYSIRDIDNEETRNGDISEYDKGFREAMIAILEEIEKHEKGND